MLTILHISDPHSQTETMARLDALARAHPTCDVLALTGDCTSQFENQLPDHWNDWPQPYKPSVPGNHDSASTFELLNDWDRTNAPWRQDIQDFTFIGLDTSDLSNPYASLERQLNAVRAKSQLGVVIVILTHQWPLVHELRKVGALLRNLLVGRKLLILDGHNHPRGSAWESATMIGGVACSRSTVISCNQPRGSGHLITWDGEAFKCSNEQGPYSRLSKPSVIIRKIEMSKVRFFSKPVRRIRNASVTCACGLSYKRYLRSCPFCGRPSS